MFRFASPQYLLVLWILPLLIGVLCYSVWMYRKKIKLIGDLSVVKLMMPFHSDRRFVIKEGILIIVIALFIIVLARPQYGIKVDTQKKQGIEVMFALDVSNSMMAKDISPNRLERAKMIMTTMVEKMENNLVGLVIFAGEAFIQLPITSDYVSARMFLNTVSPAMIISQGTDLGRAISLSTKGFTNKEGVGRALVIITDGENHDGDAESEARKAREKGINVYIMGIGSSKGSPIPLDEYGNFMLDNNGNTVVTRLNEDMCRRIASAGGGEYFHIDNSIISQERLLESLDALEKGEFKNVRYSEYDEQFPIIMWIIVLLIICEVCIWERKNPLWKKIKIFRK